MLGFYQNIWLVQELNCCSGSPCFSSVRENVGPLKLKIKAFDLCSTVKIQQYLSITLLTALHGITLLQKKPSIYKRLPKTELPGNGHAFFTIFIFDS